MPRKRSDVAENQRLVETHRNRTIAARPDQENDSPIPGSSSRHNAAAAHRQLMREEHSNRARSMKSRSRSQHPDVSLGHAPPPGLVDQVMPTPGQGLINTTVPQSTAGHVPTLSSIDGEAAQDDQDEGDDSVEEFTPPTSKVTIEVQNDQLAWEQIPVLLGFEKDKPRMMKKIADQLRLPIKLVKPGKKTNRVRSETLGNLVLVGTVDFLARLPSGRLVRFERCPVLDSKALKPRWGIFIGMGADKMLEIGDAAGGAPTEVSSTNTASVLQQQPDVRHSPADAMMRSLRTIPAVGNSSSVDMSYAGASHVRLPQAGPPRSNYFYGNTSFGTPSAAAVSPRAPYYPTAPYSASFNAADAGPNPYFGGNNPLFFNDLDFMPSESYGDISSAVQSGPQPYRTSGQYGSNLDHPETNADHDTAFDSEQPQPPSEY